MYSSLISLTAKSCTAGSIRLSQGARSLRADSVSGAGSASPAASSSRSAGEIVMGNRTDSEIAPKSKSVSSPRGGRIGSQSPGRRIPAGSTSTRIGAGR